MTSLDPSTRRVALITGAAYGIGAATAVRLARDGFDIAITELARADLASTASAVRAAGGRVCELVLDIRSIAAIDEVVAATLEGLGRLDVLVNNAGVPLSKAALDVEPD